MQRRTGHRGSLLPAYRSIGSISKTPVSGNANINETAEETSCQFCYCSVWLSMNTLLLDEKTIFVEEQEKAQQQQFHNLGFEVIPVPFWEVGAFGGGLHCSTADVYRESTFEDYFPKQIPGY